MSLDPANLPPNIRAAIARPKTLSQKGGVPCLNAPATRRIRVMSPDTGASTAAAESDPQAAAKAWSFTLSGIVRGGKNNMGVTRAGKHYPKTLFRRWRDDAVAQIREQIPKGWQPINTPVNVRVLYVAGDRRRRDFPAIIDAAWHVLERAGVVSDDTHLWPAESSRDYDKAAPRLTISSIP